MAGFSVIDHGAWASVATGASPANDLLVPYPAAANGTTVPAEDRIYMILHSKPDSGTIAPSGSWTHAFTATGGGGVVGSSTGPTKVDVYYRDHPGTALVTTTSVNTSSVGASGVASGKMIQVRPSAAGTPTWSHDMVSFSRTSNWDTSPTGFTSSSGMAVADDDLVIFGFFSGDDGGTDTLSTVTQTGTTFGTPAQIGTKESTSLGNDIGSDIWQVEATAGSGSGALSFTGSSTVNETRVFTWLRIRLTQGGGGTNASAESASIGLAAQTAAANYSSSPTIGSAAVTLSGQDATVATSISRTPTTATISMAAEQPTTSSSLTRTAGFASPTMSAEQPTVTVQTNVPAATFGMAAHDGLVSSVTTQAPAGVAALGLAAQSATTTIQTGSGSASIGLAAQPGVVLGGATTAPGLASFSLTARDPSVSVMASAGLASIGFVAQDVINSDQSIACAFFETVVVVDSHETFVGVEEHIGSVVLDAHSGSVEVDAHYATAEICGRS